MSGPSRARARGARLGGSRLVKGAAGAAVSLQKSRLDVPPVGRRPCRTRPGTGRTVRGVALLSCAVRVRSVVWREAAGVVFARVSGPVSSVAGVRAACGAVAALGSARGPPPPLAVARGDWEDLREDLCFCLDRGHEYR